MEYSQEYYPKLMQLDQVKLMYLKDAAVVTTGKIVGFQEGIIDMTGPEQIIHHFQN